MKRAIYMVVATAMLAALVGCVCPHHGCCGGLLRGSCAAAPEGCAPCGQCRACGGRGCGLCNRDPGNGGEAFTAGPATGAVSYPYYTTRGPRDFLARNPQSIGP